ncbi:MAG: tRNA (adenosine(37)-N6)-threonylcarbamoyltransferase complex ATPase subunit type 1 TsaE [Anaerolineaceae bacterium]
MPILDPNTFEFFSRSPEQTRRLGMRLGALIKRGDVICLYGDLGSGKTTLVQGLAQGWGSMDAVSSPTFVLVNTYRKPAGDLLFHLDAYRLESAREAEDLDLERMFDDGAFVVEWAERINEVLPKERMAVILRWISDEQRALSFKPVGEHYVRMLNEFQNQVVGGHQ